MIDRNEQVTSHAPGEGNPELILVRGFRYGGAHAAARNRERLSNTRTRYRFRFSLRFLRVSASVT